MVVIILHAQAAANRPAVAGDRPQAVSNVGRPKPAPIFMVEKGVRQLFLDDAGIERIEGLQRVVHQPRRYPNNPIVKGEHPWERASASVYGTMLYDAEKRVFRLWYLCSPGPPESGRKWVEVGGYRRVTNCTLLAHAVSKDAVTWEKPDLGQLSFEGSKKNNLIDIGIDNPEGVGVLCDPPDGSRCHAGPGTQRAARAHRQAAIGGNVGGILSGWDQVENARSGVVAGE
jgi:hypothetical protein